MFGRFRGGLVLIIMAAPLAGCGDGNEAPTGTPALSGPSVTADGTACDGDLLTTAPLTHVTGGFEVDYLGDRFSLASGDFNGDGIDDALMGAPLADGPGDSRLNSGEAYIIFGAQSLPTEVDAGDYEGFVVYGAAEQDNLGLSVDGADINNDGIDDILVGARFASPSGRTNAGETYVIFGRRGLSGTFDMSAGDADVTISGIETGDFSGILVAGGDVTGDGVDDILIGAIGAAGPDNTRSRAGEIYAIEGGDDLPARIDLAEEEPFATIYGAAREDALPGRLAVADLDGNGRNEVIAGAPQGTPGGDSDLVGAGLIYAVELPDGGGAVDLSEDDALLTVRGASLRASLGYALATGDIDGDGVSDLVAAARDADGLGERNNSGEVYVILGDEDLPSSIDLASDQTDARIIGADRDDSFGFSVAVGDFDGDDRADIVVGAALADSCANSRADGGELYLIPGKEVRGETDLASQPDTARVYGAESGDELGFSLATGDFDGDGLSEVLAGALLADGPGNARPDTGEVYIVDVELD
ncbi:MAG TPA: FG-GAP repeat protein [Dehalococcoidia bacterium]|nr:FG-GAP repeat protein [Dehalococcoidia bacterium]